MPSNIDYSQALPPADLKSRRRLRLMIAFVQWICLPFLPLPLTIFTPWQGVVLAGIGVGAIAFVGDTLLWLLRVPRRFSIRSAAIKAIVGFLFFAIEYPQAHKGFVIAITQSSYTITTCLIVQDCQRYASLHGGNWPAHLGPDISSWVISSDGADHCRIDVERNNPQALPLTVTYHRPKTTNGNEIVMEAVNAVPGCGYAVVSQDCVLKWKASVVMSKVPDTSLTPLVQPSQSRLALTFASVKQKHLPPMGHRSTPMTEDLTGHGDADGGRLTANRKELNRCQSVPHSVAKMYGKKSTSLLWNARRSDPP